MNKRLPFAALAGVLTLSVGCQSTESQDSPAPTPQTDAAHDGMAQSPAPSPAPSQDDGTLSGTVVETMDSGGYTYVMIRSHGKDVWVAGPAVTLAIGDMVTFDASMLMANYYSKTLERTFPEVYFTGSIMVGAQ
ncbi:MAG: hypothetical protein ACI9EF_003111 [Pseudohongiellaceae bacterium]|jgi:hypothetical protein